MELPTLRNPQQAKEQLQNDESSSRQSRSNTALFYLRFESHPGLVHLTTSQISVITSEYIVSVGILVASCIQFPLRRIWYGRAGTAVSI